MTKKKGTAYHWPSKAVRKARDRTICRLHDSGKRKIDIATQLGIPYSIVNYTLRKEGKLSS